FSSRRRHTRFSRDWSSDVCSFDLDPKDARLYVALAEAYNASTTYYSSPAEVMPRAKEAAQSAVELDANLASAHVKLGYVRLFFEIGRASCRGRVWISVRAGVVRIG